jgi:hypothetical protein
MRTPVAILLAGALLSGCETASSQRGRQDKSMDVPTIQLPLFHLGLQGRPSKFRDYFVQDASYDPSLRW